VTFTVLLREPGAGIIAAATASRSLAVGNAVLAVDPAVGAVASQAWTNRALRHRMLDALHDGQDAAAVVARIDEWDAEPPLRQVAALPLRGAPAARTGEGTTAWAGHRVLDDAVVVGNLLTGPEVADAMVARVAGERLPAADATRTALAAARLLLATLESGQAAGGDRRGQQSAALVVAIAEPGRHWPAEALIDLRVDDDPKPLPELGRLLSLRGAELADARGPLSSREG